MTSANEVTHSPYADAAQGYALAGFSPVPVPGKYPPLSGYTGRKGNWVDSSKAAELAVTYPTRNVGLRLPTTLIGIDVDEYTEFDPDTGEITKDKNGARTIAEWEVQYGPLPPTDVSSARGDTVGPDGMPVAGIRFYRVPEGTNLIGGQGDVEIIQHHHRYAMISPSVHPDTGTPYTWYTVGDEPMWKGGPEAFPELPQAWLEGLSTDAPGQKADLPLSEAAKLLSQVRTTGKPCPRVQSLVWDAAEAASEGSAHDTFRDAQRALVGYGAEGHRGVGDALTALYALFVKEVRTRRKADIAAEWERMLHGALELVVSTTDELCQCGTWDEVELTIAFDGDEEEGEESASEPGPEELSERERVLKSLEQSSRVKELAKEALEDLLARDMAKKAHAKLTRLDEDTDDIASLLEQIDEQDASGEDLSPQVGRFDNLDCGLFYGGLINGIFGDGGTGKSLVLARLEVEALNAGQRVVHWEFDNNAGTGVLRRLLAQGVDREALKERFHILRTEDDVAKLSSAQRRQVGLVTLDALTPAIGALGLEVNHPTGTDRALSSFMAPFTVLGACGVFIDHVGHEEKLRQAGSIRKAQAVQGALYRIETEDGSGPEVGKQGHATLVLTKDNQGHAGAKDRLGCDIVYESTSAKELRVRFYKPGVSRDGEINLNLSDVQDLDTMLEKARLTEAEQEDLIFDVMDQIKEAVNKPKMYQKLQDMRLRSSISERTVGIRLDSLVAQGRLVSYKGHLPGNNTGRKSDVYMVNPNT